MRVLGLGVRDEGPFLVMRVDGQFRVRTRVLLGLGRVRRAG